MFTSVFSTVSTLTAPKFALMIGAALLAGCFISLFFNLARKDAPAKGLAMTLFVLPAIAATVIVLASSSVAAALSMGGLFALLRFRSAPARAQDLLYLFLSLLAGLAAGMGYIAIALCAALVFGALLLILSRTGFGEARGRVMTLRLFVPEDLNYENAFDDIFARYASSVRLSQVKTADMGTVFRLTYVVNLKDDCNTKNLLDELRVRNGNMTVQLTDAPTVNEFEQ